jgi:hypothetical protein
VQKWVVPMIWFDVMKNIVPIEQLPRFLEYVDAPKSTSSSNFGRFQSGKITTEYSDKFLKRYIPYFLTDAELREFKGNLKILRELRKHGVQFGETYKNYNQAQYKSMFDRNMELQEAAKARWDLYAKKVPHPSWFLNISDEVSSP